MDILTKKMEHLHGPCPTPLHPLCKIPLCPEKADVCHCACELRNFFCGKRWLDPIVDIGCFGGVSVDAGALVESLCAFMCSPQGVTPYPHLGWISNSGGPIKSPPVTVTGSQFESCKAKQLSQHEDVTFPLRIQFQEQEVDMEMERELASPGSTFAPSHEAYLTSLSKKS